MRLKHLLFSLSLAFGMCGIAHAQPDVNNAPKGENPPNWNWNPGGRGGNRNGVDLRRYVPLPLTPEQRVRLREQRAELMAQNLKQSLTRAGFTDEALQTAVVNELKAQEGARNDLLEKWQKIAQALRVNQTPANDMATLVKEFREAVDKEKARRTTAATALETQFQISQKPVLDALLMTLGVTGDEAGFMGQITGNGRNQVLTLPALGERANDGTPLDIAPRFALPNNGGGIADGGLLGNQPLRILPLPQNGANNAMPNAAPRKDDRPRVFF